MLETLRRKCTDWKRLHCVKVLGQGVAVCTYNPNTRKVEARGSP